MSDEKKPQTGIDMGSMKKQLDALQERVEALEEEVRELRSEQAQSGQSSKS